MQRSKRLLILVGVLAVVCAAGFLATRIEEKQEQIEASGETALAIDAESVTALSWTSGEESFAFHKDGDWLYDADEAFPVDEEALDALLAPFADFSADFIIRDVTDFAQYGLEEPTCTIEIQTADAAYTIDIGDMSTMDDQRYVSIGDGNVYLAIQDPMDAYEVELSDLIKNDEIPDMETVTALSLEGETAASVSYVESGGPSYSDEDVYYFDRDGESLPLDTELVEDYVDEIQDLILTDYATYNASEIELAAFGLTDPALTVTLEYEQAAETDGETGEESAEPETVSGTLVLHVGRVEQEEEAEEGAEETEAPEESETPEETAESADGETGDAQEEAAEEVSYDYYLRVGESQIVYNLSESDGEALFAGSYDDLRHRQVFWGDFDDVTEATILLDGQTLVLTAETAQDETGESAEATATAAAEDGTEDEEPTWTCNGEEVSVMNLRDTLAALTAESFTSEAPADQLEISLTLELANESCPQVRIELYRYDSADCLAVVDGVPTSFVAREDVVDLMEAVRAIQLG
ncbi:MAG: DUF4340 domain-containing protein [Candidatus Spyradocola sp.]|jgi:hypothetical protein